MVRARRRRRQSRKLIGDERYLRRSTFATPLSGCRERDTRGPVPRKADAGDLLNFPGGEA